MKFQWKIRIHVSRGNRRPGVREPSVQDVDVQIPPVRVLGGDVKSLALETGGLEEAFFPVARRYRRQLKRFMAAMIAGFFLALFAVLVPGRFGNGLGIVGGACIVIALILFFSLPALTCPACQKAADGTLDRFCPECGSAGLQKRWMTAAHCDECGRKMGASKYRNYRVRYCTHCGSLLCPGGV